ncbi:hypothetical protein HHK36_024858 [Tetracentron sinense]|uniref:Formin-like protein n=1 Tax=Tetracentron sinense TaxID=13715 RepID=A0A835D4H5_TETSI|nr:hypothetical protein HHK36_024858 [Tetracentron sinense]
MESLFGYVATNGKSPVGNKTSTNPSSSNTGPPPQILILDPSKSQNTAIVVRSLTISRKEILDALLNGHVLNSDTLEKLTRIAPTKEEEAQILEFDGNSTKLADAESFLYHLLKAVPSAFTRLDAMLFRSNYDLEIRHFKESLQTLELGCKELRNRGLFLKLVDAILSGNRMNAGTASGNAQAFDLTALQKLSDVKSTDGKTTLLHFVVEEIVRSEGKRCVINRNHSLDRSNSSNLSSGSGTTKEEREKEYIRLGLPVVGGLSLEFFNIKKAATIDCDAFINTCSTLTTGVAKIRQSMARCGSEGGRFLREMKAFLEEAEKELKVVRQEQTKVMELVKRTGEYYPSGASKDRGANPLQLFVIIRDFLGMVDQVFVDVARNLQKRKTGAESGGLSSPYSPATRIPVKSPDLTAHFTSDKSMTSTSSDSEDGF